MSGFVSKISAAGSKGWTGLQSLWDRDNKTQLTEPPSGPPPEKTSLLSLALPSRHPRGSRLLSEDDDWPDTPADSKATTDNNSTTSTTTTPSSSTTTTSHTTPTPTNTTPHLHPLFTPVPTLTTTNTTTTTNSPRCRPKAEKPAAAAAAPPPTPPAKWTSWTSEEETDVWLPDDSAHRGILDTDKKKSTRESKRPSPRFKHKITSSSFSSSKGSGGEKGFSALGKLKGPSFGKLLNADCDEGEMDGGGGGGLSLSSSTSVGCENQVWAGDDDDEDAQWRMIEQRAAPKSQ